LKATLAILTVLLAGSAGGALNPLQSAEVTADNVTYKSDNQILTGYLAQPKTPGKHPALVVIHEWWGLNDQIKAETLKFAGEGYVALAVDLYRGKVATTPGEAHELARGLPQDQAVRDLKAAYDYLASRSDVNPARIGSVGWCMGGGYSLLLAENEPTLAACAVNYGAMPTDPAIIKSIQAPVLGNFGGQDRGISPDKVEAFEKAMRDNGKSIDLKIYPDAGHAFENPNNKDGYRGADAKDAWERMTSFFGRTLK
jgi:carboxymethylenebutenolidase